MVNYGWICPKCGRVYAPTQMTCLYCGGGSILKQTDSTQPYNPGQGFTWATTNKIDNLTTTTALNGVSNLSNCIIEGSGVDTSISASCGGYKDGKCFTGEEVFKTNCEGKISRCIHLNELKPNKVAH